jgi:asparagine synthase (glutamine-hydrolysing)
MQEWNSLDNAPVDRKGLLTYLAKVVGAKSMPLALKKLAYKSMNKETAYLNQDFWREHAHRMEIVGDIVKTSLNRMLHEYASGHKLKTLLRYEDRNSMRFSIESRTPFADDTPLIEYLFQVPSSYKIRFGWSKYLLREATKGLLPEEIRMRNDKIGFATPEYYWLKDLSTDFKSHITDHASSFIDTRKLIRDWDTLVAEQPSEGITTLWRFINFSAWMKVYSA